MSEDGAEATFAPGQDLSSQETHLSVETTEEFFTVHYDIVALGGYESHSVELTSLDSAMRNASQLSRSGSVEPSSIRVTSHKVMTTSPINHPLTAEVPPPAPKRRTPAKR